MLVPAISRKEDLLKEFAKVVYSEGYFYYCGYAYCHELPKIEAQDHVFQWAVINSSSDEVVGYIAYRIDAVTDSVYNFGIYGFKGVNTVLAKDLFPLLEDLIKKHRRLEWRCISTNPVISSYQTFCRKYNGNEIVLHEVCKDLDGNFADDHIFEIVKGRKFTTASNTDKDLIDDGK